MYERHADPVTAPFAAIGLAIFTVVMMALALYSLPPVIALVVTFTFGATWAVNVSNRGQSK